MTNKVIGKKKTNKLTAIKKEKMQQIISKKKKEMGEKEMNKANNKLSSKWKRK